MTEHALQLAMVLHMSNSLVYQPFQERNILSPASAKTEIKKNKMKRAAVCSGLLDPLGRKIMVLKKLV